MTIFSILAGAFMYRIHQYKAIVIIGMCFRLLYVFFCCYSRHTMLKKCIRGVGLMIHSRGANASTAEIVWTQILQGIGSTSALAMQVGAQASVTHADVAMVTALVLLVSEIGGAVGSTVGVSVLPKFTSTCYVNIRLNLFKLGLSGRALCLIISQKIYPNYLQNNVPSYLEVFRMCSCIPEETQCARV